MSNVDTDTPITVSKDLRTRIKIRAAEKEMTMRDYLESIVPKGRE
jgi:hypothetical protein